MYWGEPLTRGLRIRGGGGKVDVGRLSQIRPEHTYVIAENMECEASILQLDRSEQTKTGLLDSTGIPITSQA